MPSTYTVNLGIEKPADGEQSGTWGDTTNLNFDMFDQAIDGAVTITLNSAGTSGSPNLLEIVQGDLSNGRNKWIEFADASDLGASAYVQLTPSNAEKIVFVRNSLSGNRSVILFQGPYDAARDLEVPAGVDMVVKFSGGAGAATVTDVFKKLRATEITTPTLTAGTADINDGTVDAVIGGTTPKAGTFTTLSASSLNATIGDVTPNAGTFSSLTASTADINDGTVDAVIGGTTPKAGTFSSLTATTADINDGTVDAVIGGTTPKAGTFTSLTATQAEFSSITHPDNTGVANIRLYDSGVSQFLGYLYVNGSGVGGTGLAVLELTQASAEIQNTQIVQNGGLTYFTARNGSSNGEFIFRGYDGSTFDAYLKITADGSVGIGNTFPLTTLDVTGDFQVGEAGNYNALRFETADAPESGYSGTFNIRPRTIPGTGATSHLTYFKTSDNGAGGSTRHSVAIDNNLRVGTDTYGGLVEAKQFSHPDNTGNVNIALTSSGAVTLNNVFSIISETSENSAVIDLNQRSTGNKTQFFQLNGYTYFNSKADTAFGGYSFRGYNDTTIQEYLRIDQNGNVGINTTTPVQKLHVKGTLRLEEDAAGRALDIVPAISGVNHRFVGPNTSAGFTFENQSGELFRVNSNGKVLIGTTDASSSKTRIYKPTATNYADAHLELVSDGTATNGDVVLSWHAAGNTAVMLKHVAGEGGTLRVRDQSDTADGNLRLGNLTAGGYTAYFCRVWVNFNATAITNPGSLTGVRASGNVSSVTYNSVGDYTVSFSTAMPDNNYCALVNGSAFFITAETNSINHAQYLEASMRFRNVGSGTDPIDRPLLNVAIFR